MTGTRLAAVLLAVALGMALVGCGGTSDMNGEWAFTVALEEDEAVLPEDEIVVLMDLMQTEDGYLSGRGTAEYNEASYEVEVWDGQFSEDGGLYLRLVGPDDEGDDFLDFKLYDDSEDTGVSGSADGGVYYEPPEDPYGTGHADSVTFEGEAE